ncbi:MAG: VWA domain-containing protein, partial [Veillonella sp.]|nr:VWA domain-containing protein [Veillonella sp.]
MSPHRRVKLVVCTYPLSLFFKTNTIKVTFNILTTQTNLTNMKRSDEIKEQAQQSFEGVAPKEMGKLDMVIAFDTTGSMAAYIDDVRQQVSELIPNLFKDNERLRLGIVAFGDYCDMNSATDFGHAYQCLPLTDNENDLIKFVRESHNTSGGDGDEFYELVIKKIVEETPWREDSNRAILLISDARPHGIGYTYQNFVINNQIDWRIEARKAAEMKIKIDTVTITDEPWYRQLSEITKGVSVPFRSSGKTARMVEAATLSRGSMKARVKFDMLYDEC